MKNKKLEQYISKLVKQTLDEMSTTGNVAGYNSPAAFTTNTKKVGKDMEDQGYTVIDKNSNTATNKQTRKMKGSPYQEEVTAIIRKTLGEMKYSEYKKDPDNSPKQKINSALNSLNGMISKIENTIDQNLKLKTEYKLTSDHYWNTTKNSLAKIENKLTRIINKIKKFQ